ncbi:hypothetical protein [Salsuginibacillus kocurii]|nr:hypothetical protein [Salsuginibacillus kocurii]
MKVDYEAFLEEELPQIVVFDDTSIQLISNDVDEFITFLEK